MEFFRPFLAFAKTDSNVKNINQECDIEHVGNNSDFDDTTEEVLSPTPVSQSTPGAEIILHDSSTQSTSGTSINLTTTTPQKISKKRRANNDNQSASSSVNAIVNYFEQKKKAIRCDKTPNDLIFAGYAQTVNSFSLKRQSITRLKIAQIISEQELLNIEEMESRADKRSRADSYANSSEISLLEEEKTYTNLQPYTTSHHNLNYPLSYLE